MSLKSALRVGYQDDITLCGQSDIVAADLARLRESAVKLGPFFNEDKCESLVLHKNNHISVLDSIISVCPPICIVLSTNLTLLGSPIGSNATPIVLKDKLQGINVL